MKMETGFYDICLSLSANYLWGSEAQYLKKGSIVLNPDGSMISFYVPDGHVTLPHMVSGLRF